MSNATARRRVASRMTPEELLILDAIIAIEDLQNDPRLSRALGLLEQARDAVSDFVDGVGVETSRAADTELAIKVVVDSHPLDAMVEELQAGDVRSKALEAAVAMADKREPLWDTLQRAEHFEAYLLSLPRVKAALRA